MEPLIQSGSAGQGLDGFNSYCKVVPQFGTAKLVNISPISLGLMNGGYITIVNGDYKPTFTSLGGHHLVDIDIGDVELRKLKDFRFVWQLSE